MVETYLGEWYDGFSGNYYNSVSTNLTNAAVAANDIASGDIISAMTKTNLDTNLLAVNQKDNIWANMIGG